MARRQEVCRDFQRGSCRFGSHCKFLHQQPARQNQAIQFPEHRCNDPRACKERIKDDFANERPSFWRLTCYAHWKHLANDITGDVNFEELRALAYESAQQGMSLAQIASREAFMFRSKEAEFDALKRDPYKGPATNKGFSSAFNSFQPSPTNTIFGKLVPNNSPISQMFKQDASTGGFGTGPVISPPQFQPPGFNFAPATTSQSFTTFPILPPYPSPSLSNVFIPSPPASVPTFPAPAPPAMVQSPFQPPSGVASAADMSMSSEESATWSVEQWELGQIPEDEPPLAVR